MGLMPARENPASPHMIYAKCGWKNVTPFIDTTGWHTHTCDQILVVTSGSGMVATEHERREINVGDVVHIKAGERHWHGAKADTTMGHITITAVGGQATWG